MKVSKHVVHTMKERLKSKSKELKVLRLKHSNTAQEIGRKNYQIEKLREGTKQESKELKLKHSNTAQEIGHKNYQIEKLCEDKKELVGQCRNLKRRYESLEKNSKTVSEARTILVAQHADLTLSGPSSRLTCKTRFI